MLKRPRHLQSYSKSRSRNESRLRNKTVKEALFSDFEGEVARRMGGDFMIVAPINPSAYFATKDTTLF
jgi:hypothetical protein